MVDARLTHPTRGTLPFRKRQRDEGRREAQASITAELGTERSPLVHTETRVESRTIRGLVSGIGRAEGDPNTSDAVQALANYIDLLESHVDEFQGDDEVFYTFEDDILGESVSCAIESMQWTRQTGRPYDIEFEVQLRVGKPTMEPRPIDRRNPTVDTSMDVMLRIDGEDLPGLRQYQSERSVGLEPRGIWNRDTAENNDILMQEGAQQTITFEGTLTGSKSTREAKDTRLRDKLATPNPITLETRFPGYDLEGYVTGYTSTQEVRHGVRCHDYTFEFTWGERA